jgi:hypothetical protein
MIRTRSTIPCIGICRQSVRGKRTIAYPIYEKQHYPALKHASKDHSGINKRALEGWLGPRNIRGEYYRNRYYYPSQNHTPNYIVPNGQTVVDGTYKPQEYVKPMLNAQGRNPALHPFPQNTYTKTASVISDDLKTKICDDVNENGLHSQEAAHKYGLKIARVEAIVRLNKIEKQMKQEVCITEQTGLT